MIDAHDSPAPPAATLTPDERAVAAGGAEAHPDDVLVEAVAALARLAGHDSAAAQQLVNIHESDAALAAALRQLAAAGQPASQPPGADGECGAGAPPADAAAGERGEPGGAASQVGRGSERAAEVAELLPHSWRAADGAILGGHPPPGAPAPPPLREHPRVDRSGEVGLVGGLSHDRQRVLIDRRMPHYLWIPPHRGQDGGHAPGHWEAVDQEIVAHEDAENTPPDNLDIKGYRRAHDEDGNAGTRRHLARSNTDPVVYSNVLRPYAEAIREAVAADPSWVHAELDARPYLGGEDEKLLPAGRRGQMTAEAANDSEGGPSELGEMPLDGFTAPLPSPSPASGRGEPQASRAATQPSDPEALPLHLLDSIPVLSLRHPEGGYAVIDPRSGIMLAHEATRPRADEAAQALARRLGRRRLQAALDQALPGAAGHGNG